MRSHLRHAASDPLTSPWFGTDKAWNERSVTEAKENVFTFFSSGIGGPHKYMGRSMIEAHEKMRRMKPITDVAFHALTGHVMTCMVRACMTPP